MVLEAMSQNDEFLQGIDPASITDVELVTAAVNQETQDAVPAGTEFLTALDPDLFVGIGGAACIQADDSKNDDQTMWVWD